jgi:putative transposase
LWRRLGRGGDPDRVPLPLGIWPVEQPLDWLTWVNQPQSESELEALRLSVLKGKPYGGEKWKKRTTEALGLESSHRPTGRPKKRCA